jgi:signal transduction histidine kinase
MRSDPQNIVGGQDWRPDAFRRISRLLLVLVVPGAILSLVLFSLPHPLIQRVAILSIVGAVASVAILSSDPHRYRVLVSVLLATMIAACLTFIARYGLVPGAALGLAAFVVLGAPFLGKRFVWTTTVVTTLLLVATGAAVRMGFFHPADPRSTLDWSRMDTWLRISATYFFVTAAVSSAVATLIGRLDRSLITERDARAVAESARCRSEFLAEASRILASSLDYEATLRRVAELSIPLLGDRCVVDLLAKDGAIRRIVVGKEQDPHRGTLPKQAEPLPPELEARGASEVLRTRRTVVVEHITDAMLLSPGSATSPLSSGDPESVRLVRELGLRSYLAVPMVARDQLLGALTFTRVHEETQDASNVASVEELGRRAAAAIDNGRLFEAAQQALGLREEFLAIAAHELCTPVTSLLLAVQRLSRRARQCGLGDAVERILDMADRQAVSLGRLVDSLVDVSSIAGESPRVVLSEVDLADAVRKSVAQLSEPLRASRSMLTLDVDVPVVGRWDRSRVEQVVSNLLSNAIKFGQGNPIEIHTQVDDDVARLVVRDHGMGIAPEEQGRVFGRFERAVSSRNYGGFGLGLFIVQRFVERLGGKVECDSALHEGSTFTVTLPREGPSAELGRNGHAVTPLRARDSRVDRGAFVPAPLGAGRREMSSDAHDMACGPEDWRPAAFRRISRLLLVLVVPAGLLSLVVARVPQPVVSRAVMLSIVGTIILVAILSGDPRRYRVLVNVLLAAVITGCMASIARYGVMPGAAEALALYVILGAPFLKKHVVWGTIAVTTLLLVATGAAVRTGFLHPVDVRSTLDWSRIETWLRMSATYFAITAAVSSTVATLIARLERGIAAEREARAVAESARRRSEVLAEASRILASSLDYEATLRRAAELAIPLLGDRCVVDLLAKDGTMRRIVVGKEHDPHGDALLKQAERFPPKLGARGPSEVLLGLRSYVAVPMVARDQRLGALTFSRAHEEMQDASNVASVEDLGRRAAAAIDNGLLFEAAQQAIGRREDFLAIASHELRTPVTSLRLGVQTLLRRAKQGGLGGAISTVEEMLDTVDRLAARFSRLVDTLLDVSTITGESLPVVLSQVDLADCVRTSVAQLSAPLRASGSALTLDVDAPIVGRWDRSRVEQVVTNLLLNAIKHGEGKPIEVRTLAEDGVARLVVRDHEMDIAPDELQRIFVRLERAVSSRKYGGLALGLYIVRRIVERLGGKVECESTLHQGSTFTVTLPREGPGAEPRRVPRAPDADAPSGCAEAESA